MSALERGANPAARADWIRYQTYGRILDARQKQAENLTTQSGDSPDASLDQQPSEATLDSLDHGVAPTKAFPAEATLFDPSAED